MPSVRQSADTSVLGRLTKQGSPQGVTALSVLLGDRQYLLGDQPISIDASLYGFTVALWLFPVESPIKRHLGTLGNLVAYTERMHNRYFGEHPPGRRPPQVAA